jgi:hypothetical protein
VVDLSVRSLVPPSEVRTLNGRTPLHFAVARAQNVELLQYLVKDKGVLVNQVDVNGSLCRHPCNPTPERRGSREVATDPCCGGWALYEGALLDPPTSDFCPSSHMWGLLLTVPCCGGYHVPHRGLQGLAGTPSPPPLTRPRGGGRRGAHHGGGDSGGTGQVPSLRVRLRGPHLAFCPDTSPAAPLREGERVWVGLHPGPVFPLTLAPCLLQDGTV